MNNAAIKTELQTITPEMALELLKRNTKNRPLSARRAKGLAEAIKRGEWVVNGDTIRISKTGIILDGQHRLQGISLSGETVQTLVVTGLPDSVFETIDVNRTARTTGDVMAIKGEKHYNVLAALTRMHFIWKKSGNPVSGNPDYQPTTAQQLELSEDRSFSKVVDEADGLGWCRKNMTPTIAAFCLYAFQESNPVLASEFFQKLNSGSELPAGSPILILRERLSESKKDKQQRLEKGYMIALIFKAFKLYRDGASIKFLRVRLDGPAVEKDIFVV